MPAPSFKLTLAELTEDKAGVRHVRTPGGVRQFDQPIGAVITRDVINRQRRKLGLTPLPDSGDHSDSGAAGKKPSRPEKPPGRTATPKLAVREPGSTAILTGRGRPEGKGTEQDPIDVHGDIDRAVQLLAEGKHIRLNRPEEAATLIKKLHDVVADAKKRGKAAPTYDLCKVSVPNTNLFCGRHKGVARAQMPQIAGRPAPGSRAEEIARERGVSSNGKVDLAPEFWQALAAAGIGVQQKSIRASRLHASQMELDGVKVAAIADEIRIGVIPRDTRITVTRDGYVLDGHHRWAAKVYEDIEDGQLGDLSIEADVLDMDIGAGIDFARRFVRDMGIGAETMPGDVADASTVDVPDVPDITVSAAEVKAGDQIADTAGDPLTVIAVRKNRSTGLYDITILDAAGHRSTDSFSDQIEMVRTREAITPDALPAGAENGRPALATYQRRNLAALDLDHDDTLRDDVRQAAARIRTRQPITAAQSAALAKHLAVVAADTQNVRQQRALRRLAASVGVVDARLKGEGVPVVREADRMDRVTVADLTGGDWIAVRRAGGGSSQAQVGKITGLRSLMGGRVQEITLTDVDGVESKRLLTPDTVAYLLPDLPDPAPPAKPEQVNVKPGPIRHGDIEIGDRIRYDLGGYITEGYVTAAEPDQGEDPDTGMPVFGTALTLREDDGAVSSLLLFDEDPRGTLTLVERDREAVAIAKAQAAEKERTKQERQVARYLGDVMDSAQMKYAGRVGWAISGSIGDDADGPSGDPEYIRDRVMGGMTSFDSGELGTDRTSYARRITEVFLGYKVDAKQLQQIRDALDPALRDLQDRALDNVVRGVVEAQPPKGYTHGSGRYEAARNFGDPARYPYREPFDSERAAARTLVAAFAQISIPELVDDQTVEVTPDMLKPDIGGAVARARAAMGGTGKGFGQATRRISRFEPTIMAELESGIVPKIVTEEEPVRLRAADNGPDARAMQHLEMVRQAGVAVREEVHRRAAEQLADLPAPEELDRRIKEADASAHQLYIDLNVRQSTRVDAELRRMIGMTEAEAEAEIKALRRQGRDIRRQGDLVLAIRDAERRVLYDAEGKADSAAHKELSKVAQDLRDQKLSQAPKRGKILSDARLAVLAEQRELGGHALRYEGLHTSDEMVKSMRWAEHVYPTDWLQHAGTEGGAIRLTAASRGQYEHLTEILTLSGYGDRTPYTRDWQPRVATHELGHRMEQMVPGLLAAQEAFLWSRTSTGEIGERKRPRTTKIYEGDFQGHPEVGWKDDFQNHYVGKDYSRHPGEGENGRGVNAHAFEVFTTGIESTFAGSPYMDGDTDFEDFMMGVLAVL